MFIMLNNILKDITLNKIGAEIGGPSGTGHILYENSKNIDSRNGIFYQEKSLENGLF